MAIETEVKARCNNFTAIKKWLKKLGARFIGKKHQIDTYYLVLPKKSRYHKVPLLRVRENKNKGKYFLEYHEPVNMYQAKEYEIEIDDPKVAKSVLEKLNYPLGAVVDKIRESYIYDGLNIDLDQVTGLGKFIEVECMKNQKDSLKRIYNFFERLQISKNDLIPQERYVDMVWDIERKNKKLAKITSRKK